MTAGPGFWKREVGKVRSCVAHDGTDRMRLAGGSGSKVDLDIGPHGSERNEQRFVCNVEPLALCTDSRWESSPPELFGDERASDFTNPFGKPGPDRPRPAPLLAARWWQRLMVATHHQIRCETSDIVGNVDVLGEPPYRLPHLG